MEKEVKFVILQKTDLSVNQMWTKKDGLNYFTFPYLNEILVIFQ